jgi:hypothetical protein
MQTHIQKSKYRNVQQETVSSYLNLVKWVVTQSLSFLVTLKFFC